MIQRRFFHIRLFSCSPIPVQGPSTTPNPANIVQCNHKIQQLTQFGRVAEARQVFDSMCQRDSISWNSMISGFTQYGLLHEAQAFFNAFQGKNVRTWTILLSGYAKHGMLDEARMVFESMPERNAVSWNAMISGYIQNGHLKQARKLFDQMPERNIASWNSMITGYCHCGIMSEARELFDQMEERSCVSWMTVISGYVAINESLEAWIVFLMMLRSGMKPDQGLFVVALSAVTGLNGFRLVESLRTVSTKMGYEGHVVVGTSILNAYTRNGSLEHAMKFFETMPERNEYSWSTMIAALSQCGRLNDSISLYDRATEKGVATMTAMMTAYAQHGRLFDARRIFDKIPNPNVVTWNAMIAAYSQNGMLDEAKTMFSRIPLRNSASWAAMISGLVQSGQRTEALKLFAELHISGTYINHSSFTSALFACANTGDEGIGQQIHSLTIKTKCHSNPFVGNGLISMYAKCKNIEDKSQDLSIMSVTDCISRNSVIRGISDYHMLPEARKVFDKMPKRDVVSWTAIISAYEQAGQVDTALKLFLEMLTRGIKPNALTVTSVLSACGCRGATRLGEQIHVLIHKLGLNSYLFLCNALVTMSFKCGSLDGLRIFEEMPYRDIVTWNAVLAGCAQNGLGEEAVRIFEQMQATGVSPNEISFLGILCACSHAGLVENGWSYFNSMEQDYTITPSVHHYTCMVDLLGRAGRLNEAASLIENMPLEPDSAIWKALLGACWIHRDNKLGKKVAERLLKMGKQRSGTYVLLSNMYASQGMWEKVREIRELMKNRGVTKEPAVSWVQIKNKVHYFQIGDKRHEEFEEINSKLKDLYRNFKATGYVPDTNFVLHDVEEEQKQDELLHHSEKLAVVYGIMRTPSGSPIQILKNLRICGDCHSFMKFVSKIDRRKIIIRDGNRFHHFQDGFCSCGDYW
ncbi:pentatricopeptide repeat-containing protein At4g02750-like [Humulus lupulus]|uniref:pentatricopeptide repeat-containing protein At4g02750-like n=1 Tax=Humulus lupulus TaxID=3486 RepID=UPI002B408352|nr:pentatricopeptide repeat-containing protein At4g02750-like [Humulus lupulus]XP_062084354.1 pentatricopeptide repeat-containing protein At4g02750-like [Humulus lupulus]